MQFFKAKIQIKVNEEPTKKDTVMARNIQFSLHNYGDMKNTKISLSTTF